MLNSLRVKDTDRIKKQRPPPSKEKLISAFCFLYPKGRAGSCPAAELLSAMECVCLLPKQWPTSWCWEEGDANIT